MIGSMKNAKKYIVLLVLFLLGECSRVILDTMIERSADNLLFCMVVIIWAVYLKRRILDERLQKVLVGLAISIVLLFVFRTAKYVLFDKNTILWYMYYIPLTTMSLLVFFMSKRMRQQKDNTKIFDICCITGLVLINIMILTNDLHNLVFRFTEPGNIDKYKYGTGYIITVIWIATFAVIALYNLYCVCSLPQSRSKIWIPIVVVLLGIAALVLDVLHMVPMINNTKIYQFQEIVLVMVISLVEASIYIGIIPSNDGYEEIFANSKINACIADNLNRVVYSSDKKHIISEKARLEGMNQKVMLDDYTRLNASVINGGMMYYTEDIQEIVKLNHLLEEAAEVINAEKEMIEAENQLLADEAMYKTKNKLYDDIARIVRPQVLMIEDCLEKCERDSGVFQKYMVKATVLNAYIKRRINLSLIAVGQAQISLTELGLAISESFVYLQYSEISTSIFNNVKNGMIDADSCIKAYDVFEKFLESYYENMSACMVTINEKMNYVILRITIETTARASLLTKDFNAYEVFEDEDMIAITISLLKGGEAL